MPGHKQFSNFWRVGEQCLTFQAAIGPDSTLVAHLTASASKASEVGYDLEINQDEAVLKRAKKVVAITKSTAAISPGSSVLYSSYVRLSRHGGFRVCFLALCVFTLLCDAAVTFSALIRLSETSCTVAGVAW